MSVRDLIGQADADAILAEAKAMGETISFSHRGAGASTLYALVLGESLNLDRAGGMLVQERQREFIIPVQTGFAVSADDTEPICAGDTITWKSKVYSVVDPIVKLDGERVYRVTTVQQKTLGMGVA